MDTQSPGINFGYVSSVYDKLPFSSLPNPQAYEHCIKPSVCELVQESAYNKEELRAYNEYWDAVQTEATLLEDRFERGEAKGSAEGEAKGRFEVAKALISKKMDDAFIVETTGLSLAEVQSLRSDV